MPFWDSIVDGFNSAIGGIKDAAVSVYDSALKPAANWVGGAAGTVYDSAIKPAANWVGGAAGTVYNEVKPVVGSIADKVGGVVDKVGGIAERYAEVPLNFASTAQSLLSSPFMWIGIGIVAIFVLPKLLDKL